MGRVALDIMVLDRFLVLGILGELNYRRDWLSIQAMGFVSRCIRFCDDSRGGRAVGVEIPA